IPTPAPRTTPDFQRGCAATGIGSSAGQRIPSFSTSFHGKTPTLTSLPPFWFPPTASYRAFSAFAHRRKKLTCPAVGLEPRLDTMSAPGTGSLSPTPNLSQFRAPAAPDQTSLYETPASRYTHAAKEPHQGVSSSFALSPVAW